MNQLTDSPGARSRIVIVGAGYAGYHCARHLERRLPREAAEIVIVSPTDYMPYTSLLPRSAPARSIRGISRSPCRPRCGAPATSPATPSALTTATAPSPWQAPTGNGENWAGTG
jgi:NADPH-dependent 2,4-dienoyl-CoA reductase/sulfur reductase-like enzyme